MYELGWGREGGRIGRGREESASFDFGVAVGTRRTRLGLGGKRPRYEWEYATYHAVKERKKEYVSLGCFGICCLGERTKFGPAFARESLP